MATNPDNNEINAATLAQLGEVKGQLAIIIQMIQHNHNATHQRIDDLRHTMEGRFTGVDSRLTVLEKNERGTALRTATVGAVAAALVSAGLEVIRRQH